jgi:hypothetical protein
VALDGLSDGVSGGEPLGSAPLTPLLSALTSQILNPIVSGLQAGIVEPVTELLGVTLGGADVWGVQGSTSCGNPRLRG